MKDGKRNSRQGTTGRRLLSVFFSLVLVLGLIPAMTFATAKEAKATEGSGTAGDPYIIETADELRALSGTALTAHYKLAADVDLSGANWSPITSLSSAGSFDGDGHTISGMKMTSGAGFIATNSGRVANINFTGVNITSNSPDVGTCVGLNNRSGVVENIHVQGNCSSNSWGSGVHGRGGVVGYNYGTIDYCSFSGSISYTYNVVTRIGGICGYHNSGVIRNCFNLGTVTSNSNNVGGIAGEANTYNSGSTPIIENCYNWGAVKGNAQIGGIVGWNAPGIVRNCYNAGKTTHTNSNSGSLVGNSTNGTVQHSYGITGGSDNSTDNLVAYGGSNVTQCSKVNNNETDLTTMMENLNSWSGFTEGTHKRWYYGDGRAYPTFDPIVYTVTFKAGDHGDFGKDGEENPITETKVEDIEAGTAWDDSWVPTTLNPEEGYVFNGWDPTPFPDEVNENLTFTAQWKVAEYTVIYNPGEHGTWDVADETTTGITHGSATPDFGGNTDTDHEDGYTFAGWDPADIAATVTADATYTAQWTQDEYTVIYNPGEHGTWTADAETTTGLHYGDNTPEFGGDTDNDHDAGWSFAGWDVDSIPTTVSGDATYTAQWTQDEYTVIYNPGEHGTWTADAETTTGLHYGDNTPEFGTTSGASTDTDCDLGWHFVAWSPAWNPKVEASVEYVATWGADTDTAYTVEYYYQENGEYPDSTDITRPGKGETATTANVLDSDKQPTKDGYIFDESAANELSGTIAGDGSLVLKVYFKQQFTVQYYPGEKGKWDATKEKYEGLSYGASTPGPKIDPTALGNYEAGYTFTGWNPTREDTVTKNAEYVAQWAPNTDTAYMVWFFYEEEGKYPGLPTKSERRTGTTDTNAALTDADKTPDAGYALDTEADNVLSGNIAGDGSLVLKIYFKQSFTVVYDPGEHGSWKADDETTKNLGYEDATPSPSIDPEVAHDAGYEFAGWDPEVADEVTADATYTALWQPAEDTAYTVEFYYQKDGAYPEVAEKVDDRTGTTDTEAKVTDEDKKPAKDGYEFDSDADNVLSGTIKGDGTLVLKIHFKEVEPEPEPDPDPKPEPDPEPEPAPVTPATYSLTYDLNGGSYKGSTGPIVESHEEGSVIKIHEAPIREGYTFLYWKGSEYQPGDSYTVTGDHTFTAQWEKKAIEPTPVTPSDKDGGKTSPGKKSDTAPKTGDESRTGLLAILLLAASLSLFIADRSRRRVR